MDSLISSGSFVVVDPWDFVHRLSCHLQIKSFTSSFPWLIVMASSTRLNKNGENEQPCLVPILKRKALSKFL